MAQVNHPPSLPDSLGSLAARIGKLEQQIAGLHIVIPWTNLTLINGWAAASTTPQYMRDASGFVHLRGDMTTGTSVTTAFILPAGCRIGVSDFFPILQSAGNAGSYLNVMTNGQCQPTYAGVGIFLNGIAWFAEN